ncbi:hypothetical protein BH10ACT6_BH10ACT6_02720 [soil metagenome]
MAASLAPVIVSGGIWAFTGSPYSLLFAVLGPVVAAGSMLDGRRQRRRTVRRDRARALAAVDRVRGQLESAHDRERERLERLAPELESALDPRRVIEAWSRESSPLPVRLGQGRLDAVVELTGDPDPGAPPELAMAFQAVRRVAEGVDAAPWVSDASDGIGVIGPVSVARAMARSLAVQVLAQCSPTSATLLAPDDEPWVSALPHQTGRSADHSYRVRRGDGETVIAWGRRAAELPAGLGVLVPLGETAEPPETPAPNSVLPSALGRRRARDAAGRLAELARRHGLLEATATLPESVRLSELLVKAPGGAARAGLRAPIGMGADGVVELDLVSEGPHAVVAGTTGTGKSELLVSWVLAMASRHPVSEVTFLLIDFKGGAAFAPLAGVPHVVGIVSDLDARRSRRAIESLRAELRRRELLLAERGVRSLEELGGELARLVIVVDEFAAVVSGQPELHDVFADLAARGRSLGLHLVLCTQRPSGVVRDGVLANVALRISLRVTDRGDSSAMLGSDAAFALPPRPRGRAVIADGTGVVREVQLALAEPSDADRLRASVSIGADPAVAAVVRQDPVWRDPLPEILELGALRRAPDWSLAAGIPFGRLDLPSEQRQPLAVHDPATGHVLVLGAARAGRSTALATFAADARCRVLPRDPADAWTVLAELARGVPDPAAQTVLIIDDLDVLIDGIDADARHEFVELLARLARESRRLTLIVSAQRLTAPLQRLAGLFEARLLLRQSTRDEHVLAGGDGADFDPQLPAGAGSWRSGSAAPATVQVAIGDRPLPRAAVPVLPRVRPEPGVPLALVAGRPREVLRTLQPSGGDIRGTRIVRLGEDTAPSDPELQPGTGEPIVLLGDPDAWQAEWALLGSVRREFPLVFVGCTASELRAIGRVRETPPPLGARSGECWVVDGGVVSRALLDVAADEPDA